MICRVSLAIAHFHLPTVGLRNELCESCGVGAPSEQHRNVEDGRRGDSAKATAKAAGGQEKKIGATQAAEKGRFLLYARAKQLHPEMLPILHVAPMTSMCKRRGAAL